MGLSKYRSFSCRIPMVNRHIGHKSMTYFLLEKKEGIQLWERQLESSFVFLLPMRGSSVNRYINSEYFFKSTVPFLLKKLT